jgi:pimeloyl-ACP methyl ester carboxylesterase
METSTVGLEPLEVSFAGMTFGGFSAGPAGAPLVLLLHGWPQFADSWRGLARSLGAAGYRAVALDQRGYSAGARPTEIEDYALDRLVGDALGFADALGAKRFDVVAHDWGAILGWALAAGHPERLHSFTSFATPHPAALAEARANDPDQKARTNYIEIFRLPGNVAERALLADDAAKLRAVYQGKPPPADVESNVRRLSEPGALTASLNWYRAHNWSGPIAPVSVPTLYVWGAQDVALGSRAAHATERYVTGPYRFEILEDVSHWIIDERPNEAAALVLAHLQAHGAPINGAPSGAPINAAPSGARVLGESV